MRLMVSSFSLSSSVYSGSRGEMAAEVADETSTFFVAVHVGAGYHAPSNEKALRSVMKRACLAADSVLRKVPLLPPPLRTTTLLPKISSISWKFNLVFAIQGPGGCIDAVSAAIQVLEVRMSFKCLMNGFKLYTWFFCYTSNEFYSVIAGKLPV